MGLINVEVGRKQTFFLNCKFFILIKINLKKKIHIHIYGTRPILYFSKVIEEGSQIGETVVKVSE
jgi:hypothetical protein